MGYSKGWSDDFTQGYQPSKLRKDGRATVEQARWVPAQVAGSLVFGPRATGMDLRFAPAVSGTSPVFLIIPSFSHTTPCISVLAYIL
jgi:hypothetical protein